MKRDKAKDELLRDIFEIAAMYESEKSKQRLAESDFLYQVKYAARQRRGALEWNKKMRE